MPTLVDQFANKLPGQLIKSKLWNDFVAAVDKLKTDLTTKIDDLTKVVTDGFTREDAAIADANAKITALSTSVDAQFTEDRAKIDALTTHVTQVEQDMSALQGLMKQYFRVNLKTARQNFAHGEQAEITAEVRDLFNQPLSFADADRPWVDFLTVWGQLRPADGFESLTSGTTGDVNAERAISVRTNGAGVAKILLRAEVAEELPEQAHFEVAGTLLTQLAPQKSLAQTILTAATPAEAKNSGAFKALADEYERPTATSVRSFVDTYYIKNAPKLSPKIGMPFIERWRDHRCTVVALAKADADPTTPDQSRGVGSIQVSFRDWISPWILTHYIDPAETAKSVPAIRDRLQTKLTDDFITSVDRLKGEVDTIVHDDRGLVGKLRDYQVVHDALHQFSTDKSPELVDRVTKSVQQAVRFQQTIEPAQATTIGGGDGKVAFQAITTTSVQASANVDDVTSKVAALTAKVDQVGTQMGDVQKNIGTLDGKISATTETVKTIHSDVKSVTTTVDQVQKLYPTSVRDQFLDVQSKLNDVALLKKKVGL
jgi:archaellum component FlaC